MMTGEHAVGRELDGRALEALAAVFRVLGEPARLALLREMMGGERSVNELVGATGQGQASVSKHLKTLHDAGLLGRRREGTKVYYRVEGDFVFALCRIVCERDRAAGLIRG